MRIARVLLAILLGCFTFMVGSFAEGGALHPRPPLVIAVIMALYLALSQFLVAKKGSNLWANWATIIGMILPLLVLYILTVSAGLSEVEVRRQELIFFLPGFLGILVGALAAGAFKQRPRGGREL